METIRFEIDMPSEILDYITVDDKPYKEIIKVLMMYSLIKEGKMSFGKGAELLELNKIDFITTLGKHGIPYFDNSYDEIKEDLDMLNKVMEE